MIRRLLNAKHFRFGVGVPKPRGPTLRLPGAHPSWPQRRHCVPLVNKRHAFQNVNHLKVYRCKEQRVSKLHVACPTESELATTAPIFNQDGYSRNEFQRIPARSKLRVAVDVDEVLGRFLFALNKFCADEFDMHHQVSDYWVYEFAKIWMCNQEESNRIVHQFFKSQHFTDGIPVIPGAADALERILETSVELVVVTSRQHAIQDETLAWIDKHFPGLFQDVYFGNHWSLEGKSRKKSDICNSVGASVLIDDNPGYAMECAAAGIHVLLFDWNDRYPWSKLPEGIRSPLITVVRDWREVEQQLEAIALSRSIAKEQELA